MKFNTKLLHGVKDSGKDRGATQTPIYQSSSFGYESSEELEDVFEGKKFGYLYSRLNNPTIASFEKKIAFLEKGVASIVTSSGMSAIAVALMGILKSGDEILSSNGMFGGTYSLFNDLKEFGIETKFSKSPGVKDFENEITENTRVIFLETVSNPKLDVYNIEKLAELAHENNIPLIVDNTLLTPYIFRPIEHGADVVIHSTSKNINGNGTAIGGVITYSGKFNWDIDKFPMMKEYNKFGPFSYIARLRKHTFKNFGACNSPMNAFINSLGLETLGLRVERVSENALVLAKFLNKREEISEVNYPGLENHERYDLAKKQFNGRYGCLLSFRVKSKKEAFKIIDNLELAYNLANLGDTKTLVIHPGSTIYKDMNKKEKSKMGVYEDMIRVSVGIEDAEDIIDDFKKALDK